MFLIKNSKLGLSSNMFLFLGTLWSAWIRNPDPDPKHWFSKTHRFVIIVTE
jgi:hypothetical protein